jgi:hypothetical protein
MIEWLTQPVTVPLWGLAAAFVLPVGYAARLLRELVERRLPNGDG